MFICSGERHAQVKSPCLLKKKKKTKKRVRVTLLAQLRLTGALLIRSPYLPSLRGSYATPAERTPFEPNPVGSGFQILFGIRCCGGINWDSVPFLFLSFLPHFPHFSSKRTFAPNSSVIQLLGLHRTDCKFVPLGFGRWTVDSAGITGESPISC